MSQEALLLYDSSTWSWWVYPAWFAFITIALEIINQGLLAFGNRPSVPLIPIRGKHLDTFGTADYAIILFNKIAIPIFSFHLFRFCWTDPAILWSLDALNLINTVVVIAALYISYDFLYYWFHRFLHQPFVYAYVHKHHHRQMAPTRGNIDAINTHPFEFVTGEYLHLIVLYLVTRWTPVHVMTVVGFLLVSGICASLNHTRYDLGLVFFYQVRYHDIHHNSPDYNFEQYIPLWDIIFGTFKGTLISSHQGQTKTD